MWSAVHRRRKEIVNKVRHFLRSTLRRAWPSPRGAFCYGTVANLALAARSSGHGNPIQALSPLKEERELSFFLSFLSTFLPPWVSLDAFVIAGNPSPLFLWCVLGRVRRSWEHLPFFSFLFLVSPYQL